MLNTHLKLNASLLDKDLELISTRQGFGDGIVKAGNGNKDVVVLCADLTESLYLQNFRKLFPHRFIEMGVAEQNLATVASGMAAAGKIPFMCSYAIFSPGRNWEQIRTTICYNDLPVKLIGSHAGITVGPDGGSHQALEDIAMMRVLPRMIVISPCDAIEASKAVVAASKTAEPTYIRLARDKTPIMTTEHTPFEIGKAHIVFESARTKEMPVQRSKFDVGIIATGPSLHRALLAARDLDRENKKVQVMNLSTIKPLDEISILKLANQCGSIVTVEDHQVAGGMGSAVAEFLVANCPVPIEFIGIKDRFGQSGTPEELIKHYKINNDDIRSAVHRVMLRK